MYERNEELVCIKDDDYPWQSDKKYEVGDEATCIRGADYIPGWDAGMWSVRLASGEVTNYWTEAEMLTYWQRSS